MGSTKWVPQIPVYLLVQNTLSPSSGSTVLRQLKLFNKRGTQDFCNYEIMKFLILDIFHGFHEKLWKFTKLWYNIWEPLVFSYYLAMSHPSFIYLCGLSTFFSQLKIFTICWIIMNLFQWIIHYLVSHSSIQILVCMQQLILFYQRKDSKNHFSKIRISLCAIIIHPNFF